MSYIDFKAEDGKLRCYISEDIKNILPDESFPLRLKVSSLIDSDIVYETDLDSNMWAEYPEYRDYNAKIFTKNGILLKSYNYKYESEDLKIYEFWDYFCKLHKNDTGLILGCGIGSWGEWVNAVNENKTHCHLVEGSIDNFNKLKDNYKGIDHVELYNCLISSDGKDYDFYEPTNDDGLNTISLDYLKKNINGEREIPEPTLRETININEFLSTLGPIDWIRLDLEGIDYDIVSAIDTVYLENLFMIQYEYMNLASDKIQELDDKFISMGFRKIQYDIDIIYLK